MEFEILGLDTETNAEDVRCSPDFRVLGVSYASDKGHLGYLSIGHLSTTKEQSQLALQKLRRLVDSARILVFHNAKFDLEVLLRLGIDLWDRVWFDTMLMQHFIDENLPNKSLDYLGKLHLNEGKEKDEEFVRFVKIFGWGFLTQKMVEEYAIQDAKLALNLFLFLMPEFKRQGFV